MSVPSEQDIQGAELSDGSGNHIVSSELTGLANNAQVVSSAFNGSTGVFLNSGTGATYAPTSANAAGAPLFRLHGHFVFGAAPTAGAVDGFFLCSPNSATPFESGSASVTPGNGTSFSFPIPAGAGTTVDIEAVVAAEICAYQIKTLVRNNGTGQTISTGYIELFPLWPSLPSV